MGKKRIRKFLGSLYDVKAWFGYKHVKNGANILDSTAKNFIKSIYKKKQPVENFEDVLVKLNISDQQLAEMTDGYFRNFLILLVVGFLFAIYCIYQFISGYWFAGLISLFLTASMFIISLFSNFWYFQLKNRKLGCSFKEWYENKIDK